MLKLFMPVLVLALVTPFLSRSAAAEEVMPTSVSESITLAHIRPSGMMQLLTRESPAPVKPGEGGTRGRESLVPRGVRGLIGLPRNGMLVLTGEPAAVQVLKAAIPVADVDPEEVGGGEVRVVLQPKFSGAEALSTAALKLTNPGKASVDGKKVVLQGRADWVYQVLRTAIRLEIEDQAENAKAQP